MSRRSYKYQHQWTEEFRQQADAEFVVEGQTMPVHKLFFYGSRILQSCFKACNNEVKPRLEGCVSSVKLEDMDAFLCQVYPNADENKDMIPANCTGIVQIAKRLDCSAVLTSVKMYLQSNTGYILKELDCAMPSQYEKWLYLARELGSWDLELIITEHIESRFDRLFEISSDGSWVPVFELLSGKAMLHFAKAVRTTRKLDQDWSFEICSKCAECKNEEFHCKFSVRELMLCEKRFTTKSKWKCPSCGGSNRQYIFCRRL